MCNKLKNTLLTFFMLELLIFQSSCQDYIGPCTCDLTRFSCDADCCCDPDCTLEDRQTFSTCISTYKYENPLSCTQSAVLNRAFTLYTSNTSSGDFFCVHADRFTSRNYYTNPSIDATSDASVSTAISAFDTSYSFSDVTSDIDPVSIRTTYKTNVPVQVMFSTGNLTGFLVHPRPTNSPLCSYANPALFLDSSTSNCPRTVTVASCSTTPDSTISLASFVSGFRVARQPTVLNSVPDPTSTDLISIVQSSITCLNASGLSVNCSGVPAPTYNATSATCANVLSQLTYSIKYATGTGISSVAYSAVLQTVSVSATVSSTLLQKFSFGYGTVATNVTGTYPRSGNPGYLAGRPLVAGFVNGSAVSVSSDSTSWVTLPVVNTDGSCASDISTTTGQSVLYGENLRGSCTRSLAWNASTKALSSSCASINADIRNSLIGLGMGENMSLATFGNSSVTQVGDWFPVIVQDSCRRTPTQQSTACTQMILGARLDVLVAKAGSLSFPQGKLIGARLSCDVGTILFQCAAGSCEAAASSMKFLTTYTVSFIDVSSALQEGAKQRPVYLLRLPTDFFYPLFTYSDATNLEHMGRLWLLCLATAVLAGWQTL